MASLSQYVTAIRGVTSVKTNQSLGSLQIHFDKQAVSYHSILETLARQGFVPWMKPRVRSQI